MTIAADVLKRDANPLLFKDLDISGWPDIDPATVVMALSDVARSQGVELTQEVMDKAHAVQTALVNPVAYADAYVFEKTVEALNGLSPHFGYFPVELSVARIAFGVAVMCKLRPDEEWGVGVKRYCREILREQGIMSIPASMACVQFDDVHDRREEVVLNDAQKRIQQERLAEIEDYVKLHLED